jgi:hypothetical protein
MPSDFTSTFFSSFQDLVDVSCEPFDFLSVVDQGAFKAGYKPVDFLPMVDVSHYPARSYHPNDHSRYALRSSEPFISSLRLQYLLGQDFLFP